MAAMVRTMNCILMDEVVDRKIGCLFAGWLVIVLIDGWIMFNCRGIVEVFIPKPSPING